MYVRTMYITAAPDKIGPALDIIAKEAPGMLAEQEGYQGLGLFADRAVGKILVGSWWESEQAMKDSDAALRDRRMRMLEPFVSTISVIGLEAAAFTRPESATTGGFRLQRMMFDPSLADRLVQTYKDIGMVRLSELDGFAGTTLLIDRARGMASVGVVFKDMASLEASRGPQAEIRKAAYQQLGGGVQLIALEELEVVDLEVPSKKRQTIHALSSRAPEPGSSRGDT